MTTKLLVKDVETRNPISISYGGIQTAYTKMRKGKEFGPELII